MLSQHSRVQRNPTTEHGLVSSLPVNFAPETQAIHMDLQKSKRVLITGAAGGLGSALSNFASINGWQVVLVDNDKRKLEKVYDSIVASGGVEPCLYPADLASIGPDDCQDLVVALQEQLGGLDALVHCAVAFSGLQPLDLIEPRDWLQQMQVNVNAPWLLSVKLLPLLKLSNHAKLVFIQDAQVESKALWGTYPVSKAAARALAVQFASELANSSIRVHAVDPGPMRTQFRSSVYHSENPDEVIAPEIRARQLLAILESDDPEQELLINLYQAAV